MDPHGHCSAVSPGLDEVDLLPQPVMFRPASTYWMVPVIRRACGGARKAAAAPTSSMSTSSPRGERALAASRSRSNSTSGVSPTTNGVVPGARDAVAHAPDTDHNFSRLQHENLQPAWAAGFRRSEKLSNKVHRRLDANLGELLGEPFFGTAVLRFAKIREEFPIGVLWKIGSGSGCGPLRRS